MKKLFALLLCIGLMFAMTACGGNGNKGGSTPDSAQSSVSGASLSDKANIIDPKEEVFVIKTDYCDMKYPAKWKDKVKVDVTSEKVSVTTADGKVKLFDLCFGGNEGYVYGTITGDKPTELRVVSYDIDKNQKDFEELCAMQDDMNIILQYLVDEKKLTVS